MIYHIIIEMKGIREMDIKNRTYYFFDDMINIRSLDPNKIKIDENSYKTFSFITLVVWHQIA